MIARWLTVNIITVCIIVFWGIYKGYESNIILVGKILAQAAFVLFLINVNMYFVFLLIRKSKIRNVKVKLAKISKRMMKYHIPIAITASMLIISHAAIMIYVHYDHLWKVKITSGVITIGVLAVLIHSGLLRRWKASGKRRRFHYTMAFVFFVTILIHIFI